MPSHIVRGLIESGFVFLGIFAFFSIYLLIGYKADKKPIDKKEMKKALLFSLALGAANFLRILIHGS